MKSMNKVQLIGYLGKNTEIREHAPGKTFATIRLETNPLFPPERRGIC
jgi:single-stranded DNA-binding protein